MSRLMILLVACAILLNISPGSAQSDYGRTGFFVGAGGGIALENFDLDEAETVSGVSIDVSNSAAINGRIGYRLHPYIAAEVLFEYYPEFELEAVGTTFAEADGFTFMLNAKGYPLDGQFQPYIVVGIGILDAELEDTLGAGLSEDETDFTARFGGGIDIYMTRSILINGEIAYYLPSGDLDEFDFLTIMAGIQYRF